MVRGGAQVARIRAVVLQHAQAGDLNEVFQLGEIIDAPASAQAGHYAKASGRSLGVVGGGTGAAAGQERVAAQCDALGAGVVGQFLHLFLIVGVAALEIESAAEGHDHHFEAYIRALVHGQADRSRVGAADVHEDRVLGDPGGNRAIHAAHGQAATLAVGRVEGHLEGAERGEATAGRDHLVGTARRAALQQAGRFQLVVHLRAVERIGIPLDRGTVVRPRHAAERVIGFDGNVRHLPLRCRIDDRFRLHNGQDLARRMFAGGPA